MNRLMKKAKRGFTLIELMIVVAIVGILAVLAIYGVRKYLANAKTAEARNSLGQISKSQSSEFEKEHMAGTVLTAGAQVNNSRALCMTDPGTPVPTAPPKNGKYQSKASDWNAGATATPVSGWSCLKFTMDAPQYYSYSFTSDATATTTGTTYTAMANGDLNGDGVLSTFSIGGSVQAGVLTTAPAIFELNPEE